MKGNPSNAENALTFLVSKLRDKDRGADLKYQEHAECDQAIQIISEALSTKPEKPAHPFDRLDVELDGKAEEGSQDATEDH